MNIKVLIIFGTRPEAIKLCPVIKEMQKRDDFNPIVCVTAQHREMLDQVLNVFDVKADHDLDLMKPNQTLFDITARGILGLKTVLEKENPDIVVVQGDTTSTLIGSLASYYFRIPVAHVEAGLRTQDKYQPFPEEINRRLTSQIADIHFAPTNEAKDNLIKSNIKNSSIHVTGNTVIDALLLVNNKFKNKEICKSWENYFLDLGIRISDQRKIILVTGHRRENFGDGFRNICNALKIIGEANPAVDIVYPVHLNPNVQRPVDEILKGIENIHLIQPLEYEPFIYLMANSFFILTDSGGVQEEAPSLGKPILVMRNKTERPEGVTAGVVKLVGADIDNITSSANKLLTDNEFYNSMSKKKNPYGDGLTSKRISDIIFSFFNKE